MPLSPTRAGRTLGLRTRYVDRPSHLGGQGGVWYMGVQESSPVRWMKDVRARYPAWDDLDDIAWDTATVVVHSVWTGLTGQGEQDTGHCYFATDRGYISGELRLSSLPLS